MTHAINTVSTKMIAKLKESGEEVAKLLSFFLHCILITPNQRPIAIEVDFFSNNARSHWSFQGHMIPIMTCQRIPLLYVLLCLEKVILSSVETHAQEDTINQ